LKQTAILSHLTALLHETKKDICTLLAGRSEEIESGELAVFMADECHLLWGDVNGYIWGKTSERVSVCVGNSRCKQTPERRI
jgi:hypothetical protein